MAPEERIDRLEQSLGKQDELVMKLRDAVTVTAELEITHSQMLKGALDVADRAPRGDGRAQGAMKDLDERISRLVSGFGGFMRARLRSAS